ncbi:unnamed protein product [Tenebrio molitor]|nr:unnamed protein product [Tenebrio molitor]
MGPLRLYLFQTTPVNKYANCIMCDDGIVAERSDSRLNIRPFELLHSSGSLTTLTQIVLSKQWSCKYLSTNITQLVRQ